MDMKVIFNFLQLIKNKMKEKNLKITKEQAIIEYPNASTTLQQIFRTTFGEDFYKVDITDKVFDLDSLIKHLGYDPRPFPGEGVYSSGTGEIRKLNSFEKYINACAIIAKVAEVYNEGTILNWKNSSEYKWYVYKDFSGYSGVVRFVYSCYFMYVPGFCYFKSKERVEKAYSNFQQYFEDFWNNK